MKILISIIIFSMISSAVMSEDLSKLGMIAKVSGITIEKFEIKSAKLTDAISLVKDLCRKADPEGKGVSISFIAPKDEKGKPFDPVIRNEINLTNIPLKDLLRYLCDETGMSYKVEAFSIVIYPKKMASEKMETRSYPVAPRKVDSIEK